MRIKTMIGPSFIGPDFEPVDMICYNRTATTVTLGQVLMCDHLVADAASSATAAPGASNFPYGQMLVPATTGIGVNTDDPGAMFGVVIDLLSGTGLDDEKIKVRLFGYVIASLAGATTNGDDLYAANAVKTLTTTQADAVRCLAKALTTVTAATTGMVLFNGMLNIGSQTGNMT